MFPLPRLFIDQGRMKDDLYNAIKGSNPAGEVQTILDLCPLQECHYDDFEYAVYKAIGRKQYEAIVVLLNNMDPSYLPKMIKKAEPVTPDSMYPDPDIEVYTRLWYTRDEGVTNALLDALASNETTSQDADLWISILCDWSRRAEFERAIQYLPSDLKDKVDVDTLLLSSIYNSECLPVLEIIHTTWPQEFVNSCIDGVYLNPFIIACEMRNEEIYRFIGDRIPQENRNIIFPKHPYGPNILHRLAKTGCLSVLEYVFEWLGSSEQWHKGIEQLHDNQTPSLIAQRYGHSDAAQFLRPNRIRDNVKRAL